MTTNNDENACEYGIEKNVPIPEMGRGRKSIWADVLASVSHGDSIVLSADRLNSLRSHIYHVHKKQKFSVTTLKLDDDSYRVWFIEVDK